jgi:hypothetical protein
MPVSVAKHLDVYKSTVYLQYMTSNKINDCKYVISLKINRKGKFWGVVMLFSKAVLKIIAKH